MTDMEYELYHHGIKGQKWGVRRYQNPDGSLTAQGKKRYFNADGSLTKKGKKEAAKFDKKINDDWWIYYNKATYKFTSTLDRINDKYKDDVFDEYFTSPRGQQYVKEVCTAWQKCYGDVLISDIGKHPLTNSEDWVRNAPLMNMYVDFIEDDKK